MNQLDIRSERVNSEDRLQSNLFLLSWNVQCQKFQLFQLILLILYLCFVFTIKLNNKNC